METKNTPFNSFPGSNWERIESYEEIVELAKECGFTRSNWERIESSL
jgi:hypothetical protein